MPSKFVTHPRPWDGFFKKSPGLIEEKVTVNGTMVGYVSKFLGNESELD
jgi:hypothetical protein